MPESTRSSGSRRRAAQGSRQDCADRGSRGTSIEGRGGRRGAGPARGPANGGDCHGATCHLSNDLCSKRRRFQQSCTTIAGRFRHNRRGPSMQDDLRLGLPPSGPEPVSFARSDRFKSAAAPQHELTIGSAEEGDRFSTEGRTVDVARHAALAPWLAVTSPGAQRHRWSGAPSPLGETASTADRSTTRQVRASVAQPPCGASVGRPWSPGE